MSGKPYPERSEHAGWASTLRNFGEAPTTYVTTSLRAFVTDATAQQIRAWDEAVPELQREVTELIDQLRDTDGLSTILEYQLPMEARRPDGVLLLGGPVLVLEFKGKSRAERVDVDQAAAYARDLRGYHRECAGREVHPALVLMKRSGYVTNDAGVDIVGPDFLNELVAVLSDRHPGSRIDLHRFLDNTAYRPLPSLVEAARELLETGSIATNWFDRREDSTNLGPYFRDRA